DLKKGVGIDVGGPDPEGSRVGVGGEIAGESEGCPDGADKRFSGVGLVELIDRARSGVGIEGVEVGGEERGGGKERQNKNDKSATRETHGFSFQHKNSDV